MNRGRVMLVEKNDTLWAADRMKYVSALEVALENLPIAVALLHTDGRPVFFNAEFRQLYGINLAATRSDQDFDALEQRGIFDQWKEEPRKFFARQMAALRQGKSFQAEVEIGDRALMVHDVLIEGDLILSAQQDITKRVQAERQVAHLARHDTLTDLPNRTAFTEKLASVLEDARARGQKFAILSVDLDRFKDINDVFGHGAGDALLREVAFRFRQTAEDSFVARLGGDEFAFICVGDNQPEAAGNLALRLFDHASGEIDCGGRALMVGLSIGIAIYPDDAADAATLLNNADAALSRAKADGRGVIRSFAPETDAHIREQRILQQELRLAVPREEFVLHYQPQSRVDGEITGFEALLRWQHPQRGMLMPGKFVRAAEENGLIVEMGKWVLRAACREAVTWKKPLRVSVNLSPVQFRHGDLANTIHEILIQTHLPPGRLEVEITEGVLIDDFSRAIALLHRIKALGVHIAMDDFGTGYSSLSYLQAFPFDTLKIDRSFIAKLGVDGHTDEIVRAVIGLGRGLRLPIVAEGVETNEQLAFLTGEHCQAVQGYLIGRPAPIDAYGEIVGKSASDELPRAIGGAGLRRFG
ncbi:MAG: EAL domain-containing protein [Pseudomonadota bacterium]|nr:EAL domain-containing protein [Pseudomonadota bacterium]